MLQVRLLGQFEIHRDGTPLALPSRPAQSLLSYLLLNNSTAHRREKLAGLLWPDANEENARSNLRRELWRLRKALEIQSPRKRAVSYFVVDEITIAFDANADHWLDAAFLQRTTDATADELVESLAVYRGELLPGFYEDWAVLERERLRGVFEQKMARLMDALVRDARWREILEWGERWIAFGQTPEPAYRALMRAHREVGDMAQVAKTYERCAQALRNDLGVEPSDQTRALYEQLTSHQEIPLLTPAISQVVTQVVIEDTASSNIPVPLTSFLGRQKELQEIAELLSSSRLLTLMGPGGVGKTRLAIQTARASTQKFKDGVFWIDLVGLADGNLIAQEIAQAVQIREAANVPLIELLKQNLAPQNILLVLDNCEHVIEQAAQIAEQLLSASPHLKILATSRERLNIFNETVWRVPSLSERTSRELFVERARAAQPDVAWTGSSEASISQICARLDGIPLAIELAAARMAILSVEEIARRLDDRFALLTSGSRTALPRQQTLRAAIDWSHELLTAHEQIFFRRLAVFADGFTLQAAETVCGFGELSGNAILDLLGRLTDKSLVVVERESATQETRYRLLETMREYAREKLVGAGEFLTLRVRHLEFFAAFAHHAENGFFGAEERVWFKRIEKEVDNLRAAMDWSPETNQSQELDRRWIQKNQFRIVGSLDMFWESRYRNEIIQVFNKILGSNESEPTIEKAKALGVVGFLDWSLNKFPEARTLFEDSIKIAETLGDQLTVAWSLCYLGWTFDFLGDYDLAKTSLERSVAIAEALGADAEHIAARSFSLLGDIPYWQGDLRQARQMYEEAISRGRKIQHLNMLTYPLRRLGYICLREGEVPRAVTLFSECLEINRQIGHLQGLGACLAAFAAANLAQGNFDKSAMLYGYVQNLLQQLGAPFFFIDTVEYERCTSQLKLALDEKALSTAWAKGKAMKLEQAIAFAQE